MTAVLPDVAVLTPERRAGYERLLAGARRLPQALTLRRARASKRYFCEHYLPHLFTDPWADFHLRSMALCDDRDNDRLVFAHPRGHGKTFNITIAGTLHDSLCHGARQVMVVSRTDELVKQRIMPHIAAELRNNEKLRRDFKIGKLVKDSELEIEFADGRQIIGKGMGYQVRGFHPDALYVDDPQERQDVESLTVRRKDWRWFWQELIPTLLPGQRVIVVGSIVHQVCLLAQLLEYAVEGRAGWKGEVIPCWDAHRNIAWPEGRPREWLERKLAEVGRLVFSCEYLNAPEPEAGKLFPVVPEWKERPDPKTLTLCMAIDWAFTEKQQNDRTGMVVAGTDAHGRVYVLETLARHMQSLAGIHAMVALYDKWNTPENPVNGIAIERHGGGGILLWSMLQQWMRDHKRYLPLKPVNPRSQSKLARLQPIARLVEDGKFFIGPEMYDLRDELTAFPDGKRDDLCDAVAYLPYVTRPAQVAEDKAKDEPKPHTHAHYFKGFIEDWQRNRAAEADHAVLGRDW